MRALGTQKASELVERLLSDYISGSDESIFGDAFFEPIARIAAGADVSTREGNDIVIETENAIRVIAVKSGPNPYNASQKKRQSQEFIAIRHRLYKMQKEYDPILGHAYGRKNGPAGSDLIYRDSSGQSFWFELTGDQDFYLKLIRLMRDEPVKHREEYRPQWEAIINRFTKTFIEDFCDAQGNIQWEILVRIVSETPKPKPPKTVQGMVKS